MREFESLKAERVDSQDRDLLISYCLALEEENDLVIMLAETKQQLRSGVEGISQKTVLDIDARLDRKRSALLNYQQQLYMTPRSRAGVLPEREEEEDIDEMEMLLSTPVGQMEAMVNANRTDGEKDA